MNISLIVTVLNEAQTITSLLESIIQQSRLPDEVIICDGGSDDGTVELIERWQKKKNKSPSFRFMTLKVIVKPGNRSMGRNAAAAIAQGDWLAITDAGCVLGKNWLARLARCALEKQAEVVAGYYRGLPQTALQQAIVPYVLVMPDRVNPDTFLPATRSMMVKATTWKKVGGFDESLADNEDYAWARKIWTSSYAKLKTNAPPPIFQKPISQKQTATHTPTKLIFCPDAIVGWVPPSTLTAFWTMIFRFARGDARARLWRPKVGLVFARYGSGIVGVAAAALLWLRYQQTEPALLLLAGMFIASGLYLGWAVAKNARYAPQGWQWLPVLQVLSDLAVMAGSLRGWLRK